jgi:hypothetical protein
VVFHHNYTVRKKLLVLLPVLLILSLITAPSFASVKAGAKCTKAGASATAAGKKFTCIKSGTRLVWNKGVAVKKPTPTSTPTPESSRENLSGISCLTEKQIIRNTMGEFWCVIVEGKLRWSKNNPEPSPKPTPTTASRALTPLEKLNANIYQRYVVAQKNTTPSFNFVRCPNANKEMAEITEKAYIDAYSFWVPIYKSTAKVNWLLMSEKDWDCWYETTAKFEGPNPISRSWKVWDKDTGIMGHCTVTSNAFCGYGTGVREGGIFAQYNLFGTDYKIAPTPLTVHHETVHIYQSQLMADNHKTSKVNTAACWFIEGQANLFGVPIAEKGDPTRHRNFEISRLLQVYPKGSSYTKEEWVAVLNALKTNFDFCFKNELGYSLGWFALEWTYLNYSIEEMHKFLEAMAKGLTWEQAIQQVLKMDEQTYYGNIAQYLVDEL